MEMITDFNFFPPCMYLCIFQIFLQQPYIILLYTFNFTYTHSNCLELSDQYESQKLHL